MEGEKGNKEGNKCCYNGSDPTYLLLHLANLELVRAELRVVDLIILAAAVLDQGLDLADERAARGADGLAGLL